MWSLNSPSVRFLCTHFTSRCVYMFPPGPLANFFVSSCNMLSCAVGPCQSCGTDTGCKQSCHKYATLSLGAVVCCFVSTHICWPSSQLNLPRRNAMRSHMLGRDCTKLRKLDVMSSCFSVSVVLFCSQSFQPSTILINILFDPSVMPVISS